MAGRGTPPLKGMMRDVEFCNQGLHIDQVRTMARKPILSVGNTVSNSQLTIAGNGWLALDDSPAAPPPGPPA